MVIMKLRLHIIERELSLMETRLRRKDGFCQKGRTGKMTAGEENGDLVYGLSLIHISEPRDISGSRMPSSA